MAYFGFHDEFDWRPLHSEERHTQQVLIISIRSFISAGTLSLRGLGIGVRGGGGGMGGGQRKNGLFIVHLPLLLSRIPTDSPYVILQSAICCTTPPHKKSMFFGVSFFGCTKMIL